EVAQHADIEEIDRTGLAGERYEFRFPDAIQDDAKGALWLADPCLIGSPLVVADEDERIGKTLLEAFEPQDGLPGKAGPVEMQAAAMGRIETGYAIPVDP